MILRKIFTRNFKYCMHCEASHSAQLGQQNNKEVWCVETSDKTVTLFLAVGAKTVHVTT